MDNLRLNEIFALVDRKNRIDFKGKWSVGSATYLSEVRKELVEVEEEIAAGRLCYLEEELGDVLWDYLNVVRCLADEQVVDIARVFERMQVKFAERISGIENGESWGDIKARQKERLAEEYSQTISERNH